MEVSELQNIERLVHTLYHTQDPEERSNADRLLINLQRSEDGFQIADQLLWSKQEEIRFYGARTFIVKINKDLEGLEEERKQELLQRLVFWLIMSLEQGFGAATRRKICSALVAYFIQTKGRWTSCVTDIQNSLLEGHWSTTSPEGTISNPHISNLSPDKENSLLVFISTLLQEVTTLEAEDAKSMQLHEAIDGNVPIILRAIQLPLQLFVTARDLPTSGAAPQAELAVEAYRSLVMWAKTASRSEETLNYIRELAIPVVSLTVDEVLVGSACECIYEILTEFHTFFTKSTYSHLSSILLGAKATKWLEELAAGSVEEEPLWMAKLLIAYGEAREEHLTKSNATAEELALLKRLLIPLLGSGVPAAEDSIISPALEFWSSFLETTREENEDEMHNADFWIQWKDGLLKSLLQSIKRRVQHPAIEQWKNLSPEEKKLFNYFRSDARDLIGALEAFFGISMTTDLISSIMDSTSRREWLAVEAAFFCLNSILSQVDYDEKLMRQISGPLFQENVSGQAVIAQIKAATTEVPGVVYKEVIGFFSAVEPLAQHDSQLLVLILQCLADWFSLRPLAMSAATVFAHLCLHSREAVVQAIPSSQLLSLLQNYSRGLSREFTVQEKLAGAVAAIGQAFAANASPEAGLLLNALLTLTQNEVESSQSLHQSDPEGSRAIGLCALRCLDNMGRAFRVPETSIDLDEDQPPSKPNFWAQYPTETKAAQTRILNQCTAVLDSFSGPEEVDAVCHILKSGYTESEPGPFVFPLDATATLLKVCHLSTPSIGEVFKNVSVLLEKHRSRRAMQGVLGFAQECLRHVQSMIQPYFENNPSRDPEVAALVIDFLKAYTPAFNDILIEANSQTADCFDFAISCLASGEILPKQSAALFWARFVKGPPGSMDDGYNALLNRYAKTLAQVLIQQVGGAASRSDLEYFTEPIKVVVFKGGPFRNHMREAIASLEIQDNRVTETERRVFLEKLFRCISYLSVSGSATNGSSLRGGARSGKVIQEFWAQCRGTFVLS